MKRPPTPSTLLVWFSAVLCFCGPAALTAFGADSRMKIEVLLIWAANDAKSPNPNHKPVSPDILKKIQKLPLKWAYYYEETRKVLEIPRGESKKTAVSQNCEIEIKNSDGLRVEVTHFSKGKNLATRRQDLPKNDAIIFSGNAPNATGWMVVLKRLQ